MITKLHSVILFMVLILALLLRLYRIDRPIADWHSWRQADTSAVTRNFVKQGIDVLRPQFDDLSAIPSGMDNPHGYRMVEFPIFNIAHWLVYQMVGYMGGTLELAGRITSLATSLLSIALLFLIVRKRSGVLLATTSSIIMAILPYSIFYSTVILPDPMMVTAYLGATYAFMQCIDSPGRKSRLFWMGMCMFMGSGALLLKPTAIFWLVSLSVLAFERWGLGAIKTLRLWIIAVVIVVPVIWWRMFWIVQFPEGIAANAWLYNGNNIRFTGAWLRWLFYERIGNLILGGYGIFFFIGGFLRSWKPGDTLYWSWALGSLAYLTIFATGNVQHDYYQIPLIPVICVWVAQGILLVGKELNTSIVIRWGSILAVSTVMIAVSWYNVRGYFNINNPIIVSVGKITDARLPRDAKVVAPYGGDTAFLYQTNRQGWPIVEYPIERLIAKGATHYVSTSFDAATKEIVQRFEVDVADDKTGYWIVNLTKPKL